MYSITIIWDIYSTCKIIVADISGAEEKITDKLLKESKLTLQPCWGEGIITYEGDLKRKEGLPAPLEVFLEIAKSKGTVISTSIDAFKRLYMTALNSANTLAVLQHLAENTNLALEEQKKSFSLSL